MDLRLVGYGSGKWELHRRYDEQRLRWLDVRVGDEFDAVLKKEGDILVLKFERKAQPKDIPPKGQGHMTGQS